MGELVKEAREKGLAMEDFSCTLALLGQPVADQRMMSKILVGTTVPMGVAAIDVCLGCGCIYAIEASRGNARIEVQQMPPPGFRPGSMPPMGRG